MPYTQEIDGVDLVVPEAIDHELDDLRRKYAKKLERADVPNKMIEKAFEWAKERSTKVIPGSPSEYPKLFRKNYLRFLMPARVMNFVKGFMAFAGGRPRDKDLEKDLKTLVRNYARKLDIEVL